MANSKRKRRPILQHRKLIGDAIRLYRNKTGLTQEKLAELVDLNPKYIGEVERGEKIISIEALLRIAKAVKTPIHEFFRGIGPF
ncbi:MAG: helix-turn-helix transcriptional regulator [Verrucomicrobiota bacterium]